MWHIFEPDARKKASRLGVGLARSFFQIDEDLFNADVQIVLVAQQHDAALDDDFFEQRQRQIQQKDRKKAKEPDFKDLVKNVKEFLKYHNLKMRIIRKQKVLPFGIRMYKVRLDLKVLE